MTTCEIQTVAFGGEGVARIDGMAVFVPFALPGEKVDITILQKKSRFARAKLLHVLEPSLHRISPPCPYFGSCGGCQLQHAHYPYQLELKRQFVEDSLVRIGKLSCFVPPVIGTDKTLAYRRHISLQLEVVEGKWRLGFTSCEKTFLPIRQCLLFETGHSSLLSSIESAIARLSLAGPARLKIIKEGTNYVLAFTFSYTLSDKDLDLLLKLAHNPSFLGVTVQTQGQEYTEKNPVLSSFYAGIPFSYCASSFIQNHAEQSEKMYTYMLSLLEKSDKVLDLYCGIGISTILLATQSKRVLGVEINPTAVAHAKQNASRRGLNPDIFLCADVDDALSHLSSFVPTSVIVNPPKTGLSPALIEALARSPASHILYVSCHPPTLARDCKTLAQHGFVIEHLQSFDMFPQTTHVETVLELTRKTTISTNLV